MKWSLFISLCIVSQSVFAAATEIKFPRSLDCLTENGRPHRLYLRLEDITERKQLTEKAVEVWNENKGLEPQKDEIAWDWIGSYYRASIDKVNYHYDLWTCDTEDRFYTFKTADLVADGQSHVKVKSVSGQLVISVREDEQKFTVTCTANY